MHCFSVNFHWQINSLLLLLLLCMSWRKSDNSLSVPWYDTIENNYLDKFYVCVFDYKITAHIWLFIEFIHFMLQSKKFQSNENIFGKLKRKILKSSFWEDIWKMFILSSHESNRQARENDAEWEKELFSKIKKMPKAIQSDRMRRASGSGGVGKDICAILSKNSKMLLYPKRRQRCFRILYDYWKISYFMFIEFSSRNFPPLLRRENFKFWHNQKTGE